MKINSSKPAFTLMEMIIAITVFSIFMAFTISSYLVFHRANQESLALRSLIFETQAAMDNLTDSIHDNRIDYDYYGESINSSILALLSADGQTISLYEWNEEDKTLTVQKTYLSGIPVDGYSTPVLLHSPTTGVSYASFRIVPKADPFALENAAEDDLQYQPMVRVELTFSVPGRIHEELDFSLRSSVTTRQYR